MCLVITRFIFRLFCFLTQGFLLSSQISVKSFSDKICKTSCKTHIFQALWWVISSHYLLCQLLVTGVIHYLLKTSYQRNRLGSSWCHILFLYRIRRRGMMCVRHRHPHIPYLSVNFSSPEGRNPGIISLSPTHNNNKKQLHTKIWSILMSGAGNLLQKAFVSSPNVTVRATSWVLLVWISVLG